MTHLRLTLEPVPASSRLATLAKLLPPGHWDQVRRSVYRQASYRCQACGRQDRLECHEVWYCNPHTGYQWLTGFQALCRLCHEAKHVSFVRDPSRRAALLQHFMAVNYLAPDEADGYLADALRQQQELDQRQWTISFGDYNLRMPALANLQQRRRYAGLSRPRYGR